MDGNDSSKMNFVANIGNYESPCGYCRSGASTSLGMVANQITCEAYQDLLNRGWRRSGTWLYRSLAEDSECSCVPHTIRLDVHKFVPSRAQKQVMRKFEKYLAGASPKIKSDPPAPSTPPLWDDISAFLNARNDAAPLGSDVAPEKQQQEGTEERKRKSHLISASPPASPPAPAPSLQDEATPSIDQVCDVAARMSGAISHAVRDLTKEGVLPEARYSAPAVREVSSKQRRLLGPSAVLTSAVAFPIAAAARRASGSGSPSAEDLAALLAAPVSQHISGAREHSSMGCCQAAAKPAVEQSGLSSEKLSTHPCEVSRREIHVDAGYGNLAAIPEIGAAWLPETETGTTARNDSPAGPGPLSTAEPTRSGSRHLEVRLVPMPASRADVAVEFPLYRRYQILHHHDSPHEVKESSFRRFLVDTPLVRKQASMGPDGHSPAWSYGSYHQQYWIDGELVAVAVLDVLPECVSSVYFFWEPSLSFLSLGKVSALREIAFTQAAAMTCPSLHYYYMGYFISSCPKMRYKGEFRPSDLLCMHSLCWVPTERAVPALDADMHCIISQVPGALEDLGAEYVSSSAHSCDYPSDTALDGTLLYLSGPQGQRRLVRLGQLARINVPQETLRLLKEKLRSWRKYVGPGSQNYVHVL
ncbi:hypothetical protein WJX75_002063 [Coccomyxa subellipsoidea]|uniref:Arginyl-tRNA--protein transferase n=1 Tax=Coccomyxa subellipsoidea TaxID=248742 RepID=A0ABR2YET4_9CHLO